MVNKTDINTKTLSNNFSDGSELIPSDVAARIEREGTLKEKREEINNNDAPTTGGYTVDQEGLINNYPVTPPLQGAKYPTPREQYAYIILGGLATTFVISLIGIAFSVS